MQCRSGREIDLGLLVSASPPHASETGGTDLEEKAGKEDRSRGGGEEERRGGGEEERREEGKRNE